MSYSQKRARVIPIAVGFLALVAAQAAFADGTASGTNVSNVATIDYQVGGVDQTAVSDTTEFVVDNKIDLNVVTIDVAAVEVVPGDTAQVLTYNVVNEGNTVQDYSLTPLATTGSWGGATDNFDATGVEAYVDANDNRAYDPSTDTATYIDELAADDTVAVFVVGDIPLARADGDGALYDLVAQAAQGGAPGSQGSDITSDDSGSPDDPATVEIVFADGDGPSDALYDGQFSSTDAYLVVTASLSVGKSSQVVSDPINGGSNPKAIPGATMRYTITVTNNGGEDADSVVIVDQVPANTTYVDDSLYLGATQLTDDVAGDDEGDYNITNSGAMTVSITTLAQGGGTATITFDVTVD